MLSSTPKFILTTEGETIKTTTIPHPNSAPDIKADVEFKIGEEYVFEPRDHVLKVSIEKMIMLQWCFQLLVISTTKQCFRICIPPTMEPEVFFLGLMSHMKYWPWAHSLPHGCPWKIQEEWDWAHGPEPIHFLMVVHGKYQYWKNETDPMALSSSNSTWLSQEKTRGMRLKPWPQAHQLPHGCPYKIPEKWLHGPELIYFWIAVPGKY